MFDPLDCIDNTVVVAADTRVPIKNNANTSLFFTKWQHRRYGGVELNVLNALLPTFRAFLGLDVASVQCNGA